MHWIEVVVREIALCQRRSRSCEGFRLADRTTIVTEPLACAKWTALTACNEVNLGLKAVGA
jgi:hypothetical protein